MKASSLAEHFGVSTETIRKDLIYLESQGIAQKSYGGAIASSELLLERPISQKKWSAWRSRPPLQNGRL